MCWYCGSPITEAEPLGRSFRCPKCGKDLRVCKHCSRYLPGARKDCSEPQAEPPENRETATFCDWFSLNPKFRSASEGAQKDRDGAASARSAFDDLFK